MTAPSDVRRCALPQCRRELVRRRNEKASDFKARRHCDVSCSRSLPIGGPKRCALVSCGLLLVRRPQESAPEFRSRKFCDAECYRRTLRRPQAPRPERRVRVSEPDPWWRDRAACLDEDPELFQPVGSDGPAKLQVARAKAVCAGCAALTECRAWSLAAGIEFGVVGGLDADERRAVSQRRAGRAVSA